MFRLLRVMGMSSVFAAFINVTPCCEISINQSPLRHGCQKETELRKDRETEGEREKMRNKQLGSKFLCES